MERVLHFPTPPLFPIVPNNEAACQVLIDHSTFTFVFFLHVGEVFCSSIYSLGVAKWDRRGLRISRKNIQYILGGNKDYFYVFNMENEYTSKNRPCFMSRSCLYLMSNTYSYWSLWLWVFLGWYYALDLSPVWACCLFSLICHCLQTRRCKSDIR